MNARGLRMRSKLRIEVPIDAEVGKTRETVIVRVYGSARE